MRKKYLFLTLAVLTELTSCTAHYSKNLDLMITIDGQSISLQDVFATYGGTSKSASALYDVLDDIYTQLAEPRNAAMDATVSAKFQSEYVETAEDNASSNNTSVKEEKDKILDSAGVDDEEQYINKLYLEQQEENLKTRLGLDEFYTNADGAYKDYFTTATTDSSSIEKLTSSSPMQQYINENYPYHMRHILVKVDGSNKFRSEISSDQAELLSYVVKQLGLIQSDSSALSFGQIANEKSDDTASKATYGETGLMDKIGTNSSFVNEFRFGVYSYDMFFNGDTSSSAATNIQTALLPSATTSDGISALTDLNMYDSSTGTVNYGSSNYTIYGCSYLDTLVMGKVANQTKAFNNKIDVTNANAQNYPRNILFSNNYNYHGLGMIYVEDPTVALGETAELGAAKLQELYQLSYEDAIEVYDDLKAAYDNANNHELATTDALSAVADNIQVLRETVDENGVPVVESKKLTDLSSTTGKVKIVYDDKSNMMKDNTKPYGESSPVLVTRVSSSYEGVHFMSVVQDPFDANTGAISDTLTDYLSLDVNKSIARNEDGENKGEFKIHNYINYVDYGNASSSDYSSRKSKIKTAIDGRDSSTSYAKFQYKKNKATADGHTVTLGTKNGINLDTLVNNYVENAIKSNKATANSTYDSAWLTYVEGLNFQVENFSNEIFGTLGYSSIFSMNRGFIGQYIVVADEAFDNGVLKTGVYEVVAQDGSKYYTTNDLTLATGYETGDITLNPAYITSSGTSGGSTSSSSSDSGDAE